MATTTPHIGRKIERIRSLRGMKQETLAAELGVTQAAVSKMEQSKEMDDEKLSKVAAVLGISADTIKNFSEEAMVNLINHIHGNHFDNHSTAFIYNQFNPLDKLVELFEENKKLYERLLESERKRSELLEARLNNVTIN